MAPSVRAECGLETAAAGPSFPRLQHSWADQGYTGALVRWAEQEYGWTVPVVYPTDRQLKRYAPDVLADLGDASAFHVIPRRWVVERTFSWLVRLRRLWWSHFRREHQAQAQRCHRAHRATQAPHVPARLPQPLPLLGLPPLTDESWAQLRLLLPPQKPPTGRPAIDHRLVVEGLLWVTRTSSSWRELPGQYGPWTTVASRYQRWWKEGLWMRIVQTLLAPDNAPSPASSP